MTASLMPSELAPTLEGRFARAMAQVADESIEVGGGVAGFSGRGSWSNQVAGLGFSGEVTADDVAQIVEFYASRGAEPKVELAPHADPSCIARLREAGFVINGFEQVLVRPLEPAALSLPTIDPAIRIEMVDPLDATALRRFLDVQTCGFRSDDSAEPTEHDLKLFPRYSTHPRVRAAVAFLDGEVAGVGMMELNPEVAQLFGACTRVGFRRRGVQRALMIWRLRLAAEQGSSLAGVESAPGGGTERGAIRLGFSVLYTRASLVRPGEGLSPSP